MRQPSIWQRVERLSAARVSILVFCLTAVIYAASPQGRPDSVNLLNGAELTRVALSLERTGDYADPFYWLPTGPTAHTAPGYVFVYAAVGKLFGEGHSGAVVLWALNIGFLSLQMALLPILSQRLGLGLWTGALAAAFGIVLQPYRVLPEWESLLAGLVLVLLCLVTVPYFQSPRDWQHSAMLGFLWGLGVLVNPQSVLLLMVWPHFAARNNSRDQLQRARRAMIVVLAGAALACLPWFVRNYEQFHTVFFVRDNLGLELYTSNNPCAGPTLLGNRESGCHLKTHPNENAQIALEVFDKGEVQFNRERLHMALTWISAQPRAFVWLTARRFIRFWFPYLTSYRYAIPSGVLTLLSFWGLALMFRRNRSAAWILGTTLALYPLIHYVVQFEARYRYPIYWVTFLLAAYAVVEIVRPKAASTRQPAIPAKEDRELAHV